MLLPERQARAPRQARAGKLSCWLQSRSTRTFGFSCSRLVSPYTVWLMLLLMLHLLLWSKVFMVAAHAAGHA
jgi:hypothetical protein